MTAKASLKVTVAGPEYTFCLEHGFSDRVYAGDVPGEQVARIAEDWHAMLSSAETWGVDRNLEFGKRISSEIVPPAVRRGLAIFLSNAVKGGNAASLCFQLPDPTLSALPWELLYLQEPSVQPEHVALWPHVSTYRSPSGDTRLPPAPDELRVLIAYADPSTHRFPHLPHVEGEVKRLSARLAAEGKSVTVERLANAGPATLHAAIRRHKPHLFHFAGHARKTPTGGEIVVQGGRGEDFVHDEELAEWLLEAGTQHVFFSACDSWGTSGLAETVVRSGVPSAVGFHSRVRDDIQGALVDEYYRELLKGRPIELAMSWARQARRTDAGWWAPVLVTGCPSLRLRPASPLESATHLPPNNLPAFDDKFVGRREELASMSRLLLTEGRRLITITGIGGLGKTRLALENALQLAHQFPDGVWLILCDGLTTEEQFLAAIATAVKLDLESASLDLALAVGLSERKCLLVLDSLDGLAATGIGETLESILLAAPRVAAVATSRLAVGCPLETELPLGPLALPKEGVYASDSIDFFIQAAQRADRSIQLVKEDLPLVGSICAALEGIPLALQFVAARVPHFSLAELWDVVSQEAVESVSLSADVRQEKSLRRVIEASLQRLSPEDLELLCRLAVFKGGFFLRDAVTTLNVAEISLVNALVRLRASSLVQSRREDRIPRYRILDAVRACLDATVTDESAIAIREEDRRRHAATFAKYLNKKIPLPSGVTDRSAWTWMEIGNVRAAATFSFDTDLAEEGKLFVRGLMAPYFETGMWHDFDEIAAAGHRLANGSEDSALELYILSMEGALAARRGPSGQCLERWQRCVDLAIETGNHAFEADARLDLAGQAFGDGDYDRAEACGLAALGPAELAGRNDLVATVQILRSQIAVIRGDMEAALKFSAAALEIAESASASDPMLYVWTNVGSVMLAAGEFPRAAAAYRHTLVDAFRTSRRFHIQGALLGLGRVFAAIEEWEAAALCFIAAQKLNSRIPSKRRTEIEREVEGIRIRLADSAGSAVFLEHELDAWQDIVERILLLPVLDQAVAGGLDN